MRYAIQMSRGEEWRQVLDAEGELLENTGGYVHVMVSVDDGSLPASIHSLSHSFIRPKPHPAA